MEIYERIRELRIKLDLSQRAFADKVHMSKTAVSAIENGQRAVTDRYIYIICNEFGANETWLRTGEGEMFEPKTWEQEVAEITLKVFEDDNEMRKKLVSIVANLSDEQIDVLQEIAEKWLSEGK